MLHVLLVQPFSQIARDIAGAFIHLRGSAWLYARETLKRRGLMWSVAKLLGVEIAVPSFSTLWHRCDGLALRANGSGLKNLYFSSCTSQGAAASHQAGRTASKLPFRVFYRQFRSDDLNDLLMALGPDRSFIQIIPTMETRTKDHQQDQPRDI